MTEAHWLMIMAVSSGAVARLSKLYPKTPKSLVPWLAVAAGLAISFALAMHDGAAMADAARIACAGLGAGLVAVGGHEALKPLLAKLLGARAAAWLLGRLPAGDS